MSFPDPDDRLESWKEIAAFLGRTARTVQRWEKTAGLPVRRGGAGPRSSVVASKRELSEWWLRQRDTLADDGPAEPLDTLDITGAAPVASPPGSPWRALALVVLAILAVASVVVAIGRRPKPEPVAATVRIGRLLALSTSEGFSERRINLPHPAAHLAVAPDGRRVYASMPDSQSIAVIDVAAGAVVAQLPGTDGHGPLDLTPDGRTLLVGGASGLGVIDVERRSRRTVQLDRIVYDVQSSEDGRRAWVTTAQGGLRIIDTSTLAVTTVRTIGCPMYLAYGPKTRRMFVSYQCTGPGGRPGGHDALEVFDEPTARSLMTRSGPPMVGSRLALSPDEQYLWADTHDACSSRNYDHLGCPPGSGPVLVTYRAATMEPVAITRLPVRNSNTTPTFFPDGSRLLVSSDGLLVLNSALGREQERFDLPSSGDVKFAPGSDRVFVTVGGARYLLDLPLGPTDDARTMPGLVTYWSGDGTANDLTGGMYALHNGAGAFAPGRLGMAFSFDGKSPGVSFGERIDVDITDLPVTLGAWIRPSATPAESTILSRASFKGWRWWLSAGRPAFCFTRAPGRLSCAAGGLVAATVLSPNVWTHVGVLRTDSDVSLFVNGERVVAASMAGYVSPPGTDYDETPILRLGAGRDDSHPFAGLIDELTMFRSVLDEAALARLMQLTTAPSRKQS